MTYPKKLCILITLAVMAIFSIVGVRKLYRSHAVTGYPASPPVQVCDNTTILNGPSTQPVGTVRVSPGDNTLSTATQTNPAGTTFWLEPGTYTFGTDPYGQVNPKSGNTYIGAPGAVLDGRNMNRTAFNGGYGPSNWNSSVTIQYLTIQNFAALGNQGVVNGGGGGDWTIEYNTIKNNHGAGAFLGPNARLRYNCLDSNGQYGFSMYRAPVPGDRSIKNLTIEYNEISNNNTDAWETPGGGFPAGDPTAGPYCGCSGGGKFWDVESAQVASNYVHHNKNVGLWADTNNVGFNFEGNYINDNDAEGIFYEISYNFQIKNNTFLRNALVKGKNRSASDGFPDGAVYLSSAGGDSRVNNGTYAVSEVVGNYFENNWSGVVVFDSNCRYGGSPCNTSSGYFPVNGNATPANCVPPPINNEPYYSDCRWPNGNIWVHNNTFIVDKTAIGANGYAGAGLQGLFSDFGNNYPPGTPYSDPCNDQACTDYGRVVTGNLSDNGNGTATLTLTTGSLDTVKDRFAKIFQGPLAYDSYILSIASATQATIGTPTPIVAANGVNLKIQRGDVVANAIVHGRNNRFSDNCYMGGWQFTAHDQSRRLDVAAWQSAFWGRQDTNSTFNACDSLGTPPPPPPPDTQAPSNVILSSPATVSGTATISATATDNVGVSNVEFYRGTTLLGSATSPSSGTAQNGSWRLSWNTIPIANGSYTLTAKAYDAVGNSTISSPVSVTVSNSATALKPGDINNDNKVDVFDLSILASNWLKSGMTRAQGDLDGNGVINVFDLSILASKWGT